MTIGHGLRRRVKLSTHLYNIFRVNRAQKLVKVVTTRTP